MADMTLSDIAAVSRDDGWGGNGCWWIIVLFALIFGWGGNGFGRNGGGEPVTESALCNSMNFNNLENAVGRLGDSVASGFNQTQRDMCTGFAAVNAGINQARFDAQQCCCETQRAIDSVNYNAAMNTASINANTTEQTQKILDAICENRMSDMQNQINKLQLDQAMCGVVRYPNGYVYNAGNSPFCGCGNASCCNI